MEPNLIGGSYQDRIFPEDFEKIEDKLSLECIRHLVETGGELYFECRTLLPSGEYAWFSYTLQGMPQEQGRSDRVMVFMKNIHQSKLEEAKRRQVLEDALLSAQQAGRAKSEFLSRMSHDIRTPLNAITGYLKLMQQTLDQPEKLQEYLKKQEHASQHLLSIINDILDLSSIESGKLKLAQEHFDLRALLARTAELFEAQAREKGVVFETDFEGLTQNTVSGDPLRVNQILMNLLSNAVKFTPAGGQVCLAVREKAMVAGRLHLQLEVRDTGIGMSEAYMSRIFRPFEQQAADIALRFGGSGLGLSITKNLIMMMNGTIDVESREGAGSRFTVGLSFELAEAAAEPQHAREPRLPSFPGRRVLLAEDNEMNREIAGNLLEAAGLQVFTAVNGREALEAFQQSPPGFYHLILMDIQMPVMDGYEAARQIRACRHPQAGAIPIIACSADAFTEDVSRALAAGMNDHFSKPINPEKLYCLLEMYLG